MLRADLLQKLQNVCCAKTVLSRVILRGALRIKQLQMGTRKPMRVPAES